MRWYHRRIDANTGERYYEHRAIAEWKIGRPLRPGEVVHHLNNDPRDNHPDNLVVLPNQRAHMRLHHYQRREAAGVQHLFLIEAFLREGRVITGEEFRDRPQRLSYVQPADAARGSKQLNAYSVSFECTAYSG